MATRSRRLLLGRHFKKLGIDPMSEQAKTISRWIKTDASRLRKRPTSAAVLAAVQLAHLIYDDFNNEFTRFFYPQPVGNPNRVQDFPPSRGEVCLARILAHGPAARRSQSTDAILDVILSKREHLLDAFKSSYQKSLFGRKTVNTRLLSAFFRHVCMTESKKVPPEVLSTSIQTDLPVPEDYTLGESLDDPGPDSGLPRVATWETLYAQVCDNDPGRLARLLPQVWNAANGFTPQQVAEGMLSAGLGKYVREKQIRDKWKRFLKNRPSITDREAALGLRITRLLQRRARVERDRRRARTEGERQSLDRDWLRLDSQVQRTRNRQYRLHRRIGARPQDIQAMLDGTYPQRVGTLRRCRLDKERTLMEARTRRGRDRIVEEHGKELQEHDNLNEQIVSLLDQALTLEAERPPSPREQGLDEAERVNRRLLERQWHDRRGEAIASVRALQLDQVNNPSLSDGLRRTLEEVLADAEDYLELGLANKKGVIAGLRLRSGRRLEWLLRPEK